MGLRAVLENFKRTGFLHHAHLLIGRPEELAEEVAERLKILGDDVMLDFFDSFTIDDSRRLAERQARRPRVGERQFFVLSIHVISHEAQQALLKVLEEPTAGTHFFLIMTEKARLLPTVLSRLVVLNGADDGAHTGVADHFLSLAPEKRLVMTESLLAEAKSSGNKQRLFDFLDSLELALATVSEQSARQIFACRSYLRSSGSAPKLIFEHLALTLPAVDKVLK